ncbi:hypothetical protein [Spiroplasma poulsonii]|uniref:hypothetical protein n=1 Tax=Spiroplasma poulsonii TaxID=2138 RepID=UPI001F4CFB17|nr:hypothetical protein [Spiroplasma poulsonii]UNF62315.1 hypothetical protein MNU24_02305 [Spiroplasma poulsonii]
MIKLLLLMLPKLQSNAQKRNKNNLILVKEKHDQNTSEYQTRGKRIIATSFRSEKTWLCFI